MSFGIAEQMILSSKVRPDIPTGNNPRRDDSERCYLTSLNRACRNENRTRFDCLHITDTSFDVCGWRCVLHVSHLVSGSMVKGEALLLEFDRQF